MNHRNQFLLSTCHRRPSVATDRLPVCLTQKEEEIWRLCTSYYGLDLGAMFMLFFMRGCECVLELTRENVFFFFCCVKIVRFDAAMQVGMDEEKTEKDNVKLGRKETEEEEDGER